MPTLKIKIPEKFNKKEKDLLSFIKKYNPVLILKKITGRNFKKINIIVKHKSLGMAADFRNNTVYVDFNNSIQYIWLSLSHELAHILLRNPAWDKNKDIQKIIKANKGFSFKYQGISYKYTFSYAIEQTMAILLQAACEDKAGLRKLDWSVWESTFQCMGVKDIGKKLWKSWLKYLDNLLKYKKIDNWILETLKKNY
ncbi:hypothetical protein ACFLZ0_00420 [Patescibacteria group bacterium]